MTEEKRPEDKKPDLSVLTGGKGFRQPAKPTKKEVVEQFKAAEDKIAMLEQMVYNLMQEVHGVKNMVQGSGQIVSRIVDALNARLTAITGILSDPNPVDGTKLVQEEELMKRTATAMAEIQMNHEKEADRRAGVVSVDRECKVGDFVVVDIEGTIEDKPSPETTANNMVVEIGKKNTIDGFEDKMVGMKPGDVRDVTLRFPETFQEQKLAGKEAKIKVTCKRVKEPMSVSTKQPEVVA